MSVYYNTTLDLGNANVGGVAINLNSTLNMFDNAVISNNFRRGPATNNGFYGSGVSANNSTINNLALKGRGMLFR